jgi:membrane protein
MNRRRLVSVAKTALIKWQKENASIRAAALAFFVVLPLPSLLFLTEEIFAAFLGTTTGPHQLTQIVGIFAGSTIQALTAQLLQGMVNPFTSIFGGTFSVVFTLGGVLGAFLVLQNSLNLIWGIQRPQNRKLWTRIKEQAVPFAYVLGAVILVAVWAGLTTILYNAVNTIFVPIVGETATYVGLFILQVIFSLASATLLFAIIYKEVPDTQIKWQDVKIGALISGVAFIVLNIVFGLYAESFPVTTVAGAAGALILLLLWFFVIGEILLYGAQFAKVYTDKIGSHYHIHELTAEEPPSDRANVSKVENTFKSAATRIQFAITPKRMKQKPQPPPTAAQPPIPIKQQFSEAKPVPTRAEAPPTTRLQTATPTVSKQIAVQKEQAPPSLYHEIRRQQEEQEKATAHRNEHMIFELEKKKDKPQNSEAKS